MNTKKDLYFVHTFTITTRECFDAKQRKEELTTVKLDSSWTRIFQTMDQFLYWVILILVKSPHSHSGILGSRFR